MIVQPETVQTVYGLIGGSGIAIGVVSIAQVTGGSTLRKTLRKAHRGRDETNTSE